MISSAPPKPARVAVVHDWLTGLRGGEKVLEQICRMLGGVDIYTLLHVEGTCGELIESQRIRTSFLDDLPAAHRYYRYLLGLMPAAVESLDLSAYDVVITPSHCVAKGFGGRRPGQLHVCYCFTPMRYLWSVAADYDRRLGPAATALKAIRPFLRAWDVRSARRTDAFIAISECIAERIRRVYRRESQIVYPPVNVEFHRPAGLPRETFYLVVSAMAPYKKVDHAVDAFARLDRPLKIIGKGQMLSRLRARAPANVEFLGWQSNESVRDHLRRCRALLFPGLEDFGIVPLEATACGAPVIAYAAGGALETVRDAASVGHDRPTGLHYAPQTPEALAEAVRRFEALDVTFDPQQMYAWASRFSEASFRRAFAAAVDPWLNRFGLRIDWRI